MTALDEVISRAIQLELPIAIDSSALIGYLRNEAPIANQIATVIDNEDLVVIISSVTLSEALVRTAAMFGRQRVELVVQSIQELASLEVVVFGEAHAIDAALVRAETRLKLPDAAIIATARVAGAIAIVGNDRAWQNKSLGIQYIHLDDVVREAQMEEEPR